MKRLIFIIILVLLFQPTAASVAVQETSHTYLPLVTVPSSLEFSIDCMGPDGVLMECP